MPTTRKYSINSIKKIKKKNKQCNCRKYECPLKDSKYSCRTENVIYEATVKTKDQTKTYIGLTSQEIKNRISQHRHDFKYKAKKDSTELSKYIWKIKNQNEDFNLSWKIVKKVGKTRNGSKICRLCISEAALIIKNKKDQLNKRLEIMNKCRHQNKFLLKNWKEEKLNVKKT